MLELIDPLWYGTEASFYEAIALEKRISASIQAGGPFDDVPGDYLLTKQGNIGVVSIAGPLVNSDHPLLAFFGVSSYPAIRRAVVSAAKDPAIDHIVLAIDSGGGAVDGVADTADLLARVNAKVKPITTVATGMMASAAYWLGASAAKVHAGQTSEVGSIGVVSVHIDRTKQLEMDGVKATVLRAGKFKALVNPFEPLSDEARAEVQRSLDAAYKIFVQHVADARGVSFERADQKMAQGRVFFGAQAKAAGLVDSITTMDAVLSKLGDMKGVDKRRAVYDNGMKGKSMATAGNLTEQEIAALAAGANLGAKAGEVELTEAQKAEKAAADKALADKAAEDKLLADKAVADKAAADKDTADKAAAAAADKDGAGVVKFLQGQVKEKDEQIVGLRVELKAAQDKLAGIEATHGACVEIVRATVDNMRVALGGSKGAAPKGATEALAEHASLQAEFQKKFKVGGVASAKAEDQKKEKQGQPAAPLHAARIAATRING
jgi:signal peptide peptidase SppA